MLSTSNKYRSEDLSLSDIITPISYTRLLLVYDYIIENLEKSLLDFLHQYCPTVFMSIIDNRIVDRVDQPRLFTYENNEQSSIASFNIDELDIFPYGRIPDEKSPLFFVHQLTLKDGTFLAFGIHHRLTDGHGFIYLLYRFSMWMIDKQATPLFEYNRSLIRTLKAQHSTYDHNEYYTGEYVTVSSPVIQEVESDVIIKRYKKQDLFQNLNITNNILSMNDVIVAWLTKIISHVRQIPNDTIVKVGMPTNGRQALGLNENYFGNCVFYIYIPFQMVDLNSLSVNELSERVRDERSQSMSETYLRSALAYMDYQTRKPNTAIFPVFNLFDSNDLAFSNWSQFPLYKIDFGHGPPKRIFLPPGARRNGMITILPTNEKDAEVELYIRLEKPYAKELVKLLF